MTSMLVPRACACRRSRRGVGGSRRMAQQSPNCAAARGPARGVRPQRAPIPRAPSRSGASRRPPPSSRASSTASRRSARRIGCGSNSFFVLFSGEPAQCGPLNAKIQQMRANLDRIQADLARLQSAAGPERDGQRRAILVALAQNNCGQQYRAAVAAAAAAARGGLFESLFGPRHRSSAPAAAAPGWSIAGGSYRTVCVRTCDGYYLSDLVRHHARAASPTTRRPARNPARPPRSCCSPTAIRART